MSPLLWFSQDDRSENVRFFNKRKVWCHMKGAKQWKLKEILQRIRGFGFWFFKATDQRKAARMNLVFLS